MPELTGDFTTGQLPKIAPGAVTITIARTVKPEYRDEFDRWCDEMVALVRAAPGCLGATTLAPSRDGEAHHMVFRFIDAVHLRRWERSPARLALLERIDDMVLAERVTVTPGEDAFFWALGEVGKRKTRLGRFVSDLAWIYPLALTVSVLLAPAFARLDILWRVLVSSTVMGLASKAALNPIRRWVRRRRMLPQNSAIR
ncbi:MAG: antibiotic biosynthesis monooxygenase [Ilumatobacteraceae bacterium]